MKKIFAVLASGLLGVSMLFSGCYTQEEEHVHKFLNYIAKEPTCTEAGILEQVCEECGEKAYSDLEAMGHRWVDGVCSRCGKTENGASEGGEEETPPDDSPEDPPVVSPEPRFTFIQDIYEQACSMGYFLSKEEFLLNVNNTVFTQVYINGKGRLKLSADGGISADVGEVRVDIPMDVEAELGIVLQIEISDGCLTVSDTMGKAMEFGVIDGLAETDSSDCVAGFAINLQNELLILYQSEKIKKVGTLAYDLQNVDEDLLLYLWRDGAYAAYGPFDRTATSVTVAPTHLGFPVNSVAPSAFVGCFDLVSVNLSEGIETIGAHAFEKCRSLESVILPVSLRQIYCTAFFGCDAMKSIFYCGTEEQWMEVNVGAALNQPVFDATVYYYSEKPPTQIGNYWRFLDNKVLVWR